MPYALILLEASLTSIGIYTKSIFVIVAASVSALIIFVVYTGWDIIESLVFKHTNMIQVVGNYEISGDRATAMFRKGNKYVSVSVSEIGAITDVGMDERRFENIIERLNIPFRLVMQIEKIMTRNMTEGMETQKHMREIALSRLSPKAPRDRLKKQKLKNEILYLEHNISELMSGGIPLQLSYYVMCNAVSFDRYSAEKLSISNMNRITTEFDSAFGTKSRLLSGNELINILRMEQMIV